eukprot:15355883-Ditylum_brightwellii.AAC.1
MAVQRAFSDQKRVKRNSFKKLSGKEKEALNKTKSEKWKEHNNGGLGSQYNANQQPGLLPPGTISVPMMPQNQGSNTQHQLNDATIENGTCNTNGEDQVTIVSTSAANKSNQVHAANFLQLANGNFVVRNTTFQLSMHVAERMSIQSFNQQSSNKGSLWIGSGTTISAMGHSFKMIKEIGHFANMTGVANDPIKNNVPIGSGLTCCVNKSMGF